MSTEHEPQPDRETMRAMRDQQPRRTIADQAPARVLPVSDPEAGRAGRADPGVDAARSRYGGIDVPGSLTGMLAALALLILIGGLVGAAIGTVGYQTGLDGNHSSLSIASLAGGIATLFVAYVVGGWTAGRIARYDGVTNGVMTGVWTLALAAILALAGAALSTRYDLFGSIPNLPNWFSRDALTVGAITSGALAILAMLLGGAIGGRVGSRYHQRVDRLIVDTRPGGITPPTTQIVRPS